MKKRKENDGIFLVLTTEDGDFLNISLPMPIRNCCGSASDTRKIVQDF